MKLVGSRSVADDHKWGLLSAVCSSGCGLHIWQVGDLGLFQERHPKRDLVGAGGYVHSPLAQGEGPRPVGVATPQQQQAVKDVRLSSIGLGSYNFDSHGVL